MFYRNQKVEIINPLDFYKHLRCDKKTLKSVREDIIILYNSLEKFTIKRNTILFDLIQNKNIMDINIHDKEITKVLRLERNIHKKNLQDVKSNIDSLKKSLTSKKEYLEECELKKRLNNLEDMLND